MGHNPVHHNPGSWLRSCFPEQTKSIPCMLVWTVIYLADAALIFWAAGAMGISLLAMPYRRMTVFVGAYLILAFALFWAETAIYSRILANRRKSAD